ncbi:MAG: BMP family lipoprotein [Candidatus Njordarchaeia archaeon]
MNKNLIMGIIVIVIIVAAGGYVAFSGILTGPKGKIAVVYDVGGRGDLSFNDMAYMGASKAAKEFNLQLVEVQSTTSDDYLPNLRSLAQTGEYKLIIAVGFLMTDAVNQTAREFPNQKFAIVDGYIPDLPNVLSILFKENEGSALVGALAAMVADYFNYSVVGNVLGMEIPVLWKFEIGYKFGVHWAINETHVNITKILWQYTGSFSDPTLGSQAAQSMLEQGAGVIYQAAGAVGLGVFDKVEEWATGMGRTMGPPFAIGVDADQDWIKPGFILASMMKRVDVGVYTAVKKVMDGTFQGGILELGLENGGISVSTLEDLSAFIDVAIESGKSLNKTDIINKVSAMRNSIPSWIWDKVDDFANAIKNGTVNVPVPTADNIDQLRNKYNLGE